ATPPRAPARTGFRTSGNCWAAPRLWSDCCWSAGRRRIWSASWRSCAPDAASGRELASLRELLEDHVALQAREMVDEEDAFEMVHLVLEDDRKHAADLLVMLRPVQIEPAGADRVGALDLGILVRHRQAALGVRLEAVGRADDLRVDEDEGLADRLPALFLGLLKVDDQDPLGNADLDRGEADPGRVVHRLEAVGA